MNILVDPLHVPLLQVYDHAAAARRKTGSDFHKSVAIALTRSTKAPTSPTLKLDLSQTKSRDRFWMIGLDKNNEVAFCRLFEGMSFLAPTLQIILQRCLALICFRRHIFTTLYSTKRER